MKVSIKPPSAMEAQDIEVRSGAITLSPLFYQPKGKANVGVVRVEDESGATVFLGMLVANGKDGVVTLQPRTKAVKPALDSSSEGTAS